MAENTRTFQEILLEQRKTNEQLSSLKQENRLMSDVLKDIRNDAEKDSTSQGILRSALPEILADTSNTNRQLSEFDQQQVTFSQIAGGIREMVGISGEHLNLLKEAIKQDDEFYDDQKAKEERAAALKESNKDKGLEDGKSEFGKKLKDGVSGIFGGLKGIFFGTAGIFAAIYAFVAALGNENFREVVFKATDAVKKAFVDFGELIEGDKGLLEFLRENALTLAGITALLMPKKTFGLLFKTIKSLPVALSGLSIAFGTIGTAVSTVLSPAILVAGAVAAVLFGIKEGFDAFKEKLDDTGSVMDALAYGISTFNGFLIALPATIFKTLIDGFLGLLEFITFGWLNFDEIQQKIKDMDFAGMVRDAVYNVMGPLFTWVGDTFTNLKNDFVALLERDFVGELLDKLFSSIKNIGKKIYDPETGAIFGQQLPPFPTLGDIGQFLKDKAKLIYDSETGAIFGYQLPELPSISDMFSVLTDFAKKIYNPETGEIFGFKLPSLSDLNPFQNFSLFGGNDNFEDLQEDADDAAKDAGKVAQKAENAMIKYQQTGSDKFLKKYQDLQQEAFELQEKAGNLQYQALMKKMEEQGDLTDAEKSYIQQINIMKGGDSVSQSSSTGFSTKKSAFNDDYTSQMLAGSMP